MNPRHKTEALLCGWTVLGHPRDFPDRFMARRWFASAGMVQQTTEIGRADTLEQLRAKLSAGLVRLARHANDDKLIVEVWI